MKSIEQEVLNTTYDSIRSAISEQLKSYNSPLNSMIKEVLEENRDEIISIVDSALKEVIGKKGFKESIKEEFRHKVAKSFISGLTGSIDGAVNAIKQNPTTKAKMILAVEQIISDNKT